MKQDAAAKSRQLILTTGRAALLEKAYTRPDSLAQGNVAMERPLRARDKTAPIAGKDTSQGL